MRLVFTTSHTTASAGWTIGPLDNSVTPSNDDNVDANDMYDKLEHEILPMYYDRREEWINRMKQAITLGDYFSTNRCMKEYLEKAYKS
jgi:starch phosphorylase